MTGSMQFFIKIKPAPLKKVKIDDVSQLPPTVQ